MGSKPEAGEVLMRRASGDHQVLVHNSLRRDAVVKFKTQNGGTMATLYVPATYRLALAGIPDGVYLIEFTTGSRYSRGCGLFVDDSEAWRMPFSLTLRRTSGAKTAANQVPDITLTDIHSANAPPISIAVDRFAADD